MLYLRPLICRGKLWYGDLFFHLEIDFKCPEQVITGGNAGLGFEAAKR
jgi:hypothetical protein